MHSEELSIETRGRGTIDITREVKAVLRRSGIKEGLCNIFIHHTSASLILCENADPTVRADLERYAERLVQDGDPIFEHADEGPDDMAAHVRSILTQSSISIPVRSGACKLGTWQGLFLWEHRYAAHRRRITVTLLGE